MLALTDGILLVTSSVKHYLAAKFGKGTKKVLDDAGLAMAFS